MEQKKPTIDEQEELLRRTQESDEMKHIKARIAQLESENERLLKVNQALFMSQPAVDTSVKTKPADSVKTETAPETKSLSDLVTQRLSSQYSKDAYKEEK